MTPEILAALLSAGAPLAPTREALEPDLSRLKPEVVAFVPVYPTSSRRNKYAKRHARKKWRGALIRKARAEGRKHWRWCHEPVRTSR